MNENYIKENNIDSEHRIESVINDCKVTIYFSKNRNLQVERNVLENLLDTFENRMKSQIGCRISFNLFLRFRWILYELCSIVGLQKSYERVIK